MFLYSDYDWIKGDIEVQRVNDDIPVPEVPEPATLALLACGTMLSLKRRKK
ncbi:MAG: PEP-CTERM sorting domain-containing protein [Planctomycetota bacterium]